MKRLLPAKLGATAFILLVYILGRRLTLFGIDTAYYTQQAGNIEDYFGMTIGGDIYKISIFALGISPYMIASILVMVVTTVRRSMVKSRSSMKRSNQILVLLTLLFAIYQGISTVQFLHFDVAPHLLGVAQAIATLQMVTGAMLVVWLCDQNKEFGIGGQSVLILVNVVESVGLMTSGHTLDELWLPLVCSLAAMVVTVLMENGEFRIPVQRISIHNVYKDKNYLAVKLNPIGVIPVMFATAVFGLFQMLVLTAKYLLRDFVDLSEFLGHLTFSHPVGIVVYILIIYTLTILFSVILLGPADMADQLMKSNDSICNVQAGKDTKRYLSRVIVMLSFFSATVMCLCVVIPLVLQFFVDFNSTLLLLPTIVMMLTSICINVSRDLEAVASFDSYRVFM